MIINPLTGKVEQEEQDLTPVRSPREQPLEAASPYPKTAYDDVIKSSTEQHGVPYHIGYNLLKAESNFNPNATSPAGAKGIAQFMDATALEQGVDSMDPNSAIPGSMKYLKAQYDRFGSWDKALAAYNAGGGNVNKYGGIPPFPETQEYVKKIMDGHVPEEAKVEPGPMIIDPMSGEVASGREPVSEMNPLAAGPPDKGTPEYNYLYGALDVAQGTVELARDVTWGALSWPVAQIVRHGAVAGQKIQQQLGLVPSMTPEQQAAMGENVANYIQTMGGLATPKSESGKQSLEAVGKVIEPIQKIAHWTAQGINPEKYPNLHNAVATGVEFGLFATVPKVKAGLGKIKKMRETSLELKGKEKAAADLAILEEQDVLMKKMDADLAATEMNATRKIITDYQEGILKSKERAGQVDTELARQREQAQSAAGKAEGFQRGIQQSVDAGKVAPRIVDPETGQVVKPDLGQEPVSRFNYISPEQIKAEVKAAQQTLIDNYQKGVITKLQADKASQGLSRFEMRQIAEAPIHERLARTPQPLATGRDISRIIKDYSEGIVPDRRSLSEISMRAKKAGDVVKPNLGQEPVSGTPELVPETPGAKTTVEPVTAEGIPRNEFQIDPETGKPEGTFKAEERSAYKVGEDGVKLVESVPGEKSVWQIFNNEKGSVSIEELSKAFGKAPKAASMLNQLIKKGISKQDLLLSGLGSHLAELNQKKVDLKEFKRIADEGGFDVKKTELYDLPRESETHYNPESSPEYNLPGHKEGTYKETLYKYDPNAKIAKIDKRIKEIREQYEEAHFGLTDKQINQDLFAGDKEYIKLVQERIATKPKEGFNETHYGNEGKNTMAWSRLHDRVVGDKDVVYVDELQSNWHKEGQIEGYGKPKEINTDYNHIKEFAEKQGIDFRVAPGESLPVREYTQLMFKAVKLKDDLMQQKILVYEQSPSIHTGKVPDAPFKKTWPQMIMRDVISDAIARGKDGVAWSTGKMQADRWGGKAQTKRDAIYDKTVVKFFKNELGVEPVKVRTEIPSTKVYQQKIFEWKQRVQQYKNLIEDFPETARRQNAKEKIKQLEERIAKNSKEVWYAPITGKMRRLFGDGKVLDAIDNIFAPLRNERGSIRIPTRRKTVETKVSESQRKQIRKYGMMAEKAGKTFKEFLSDTGLTPKEIHAMEKLHKFVKEENPIASKLEPVKRSAGDMTPFELKEGERQVNITKGNGNKKIKIGESDAAAIFESPPGRKGLGSWFKPAEFMFDKYPKLRNLLDQAREVQSTIKNELEISSKHVDTLQKEFSSKKLREEVGAYWHNFSILGKDAMKQMGVEINANPKYKELKTKLEPKFKDLFDRINTQRVKLGKRPIKETGDYLSFFAKESLLTDFKNLVKGEEAKGGYSNLVLDDLATIKQRQAGAVKDSPAFAHLKRTGLRKGVKLELDPLVIYSRYLNDSLRHIHMSPINAFVKELLTAELTDFKTGKTATFSEVRPNVATELASWNNKIAGLDNMEVPRVFQKLLNKGMNNLTVAQLFGNLRTSFIQSTALFPTAVKFGYAPTAKGIAQISVGKGTAPFSKSSSLNTAAWDAAVADMGNAIAGTKYQKAKLKVVEGSAWLMKSIDYFARKATFQTVWNSLEPLVKKGKLTEKEAIRRADAEINRTQGSGDAVELAPIQRNVIGKMATQWQTFTINHMNFVAKDVLGIKNPELKPKETAVRVLRYVAGGLAINALFEQGLGVQSPMPAPVQGVIRGLEAGDSSAAILLGTMMEVGEAFPGGGSIKFGSNPLGPLVKHSDDIVKALSGTTAFNKDMITKASMGDERSMIALAEILGKTLGVPGTAQATKFARGQRRGESVPRSLAGRIYKEPKKKSKASSRRKRKARKRKTR